MEVVRQRALIRASAAECKQKEKEGASSLAPKGVGKAMSKQKSDEKDDCPFKKGLGVPVGDKQPSPPKPSYRASKGLMTATGLVTQGTVQRRLTHKEHTVEMVGQSSRRRT